MTSGVRFGLAHSSDGLQFLDDFSKVTCDLACFILDSSSGFNCGSFGVFCGSGRRLIIAGQEQKAFAAQYRIWIRNTYPIYAYLLNPGSLPDAGSLITFILAKSARYICLLYLP